MKRFYLIIFMLIFSTTAFYGQGKLQKAEEDLKSEKKQESSSDKKTTSSDDNFLVSALGELFIDLVFYSSYALLIESRAEVENLASDASITKYPYYQANKGNYSYDWDEGTSVSRFTFSSRYIFESTRIEGNHLTMQLRFLKRIGLEFDYLQLWEKNPNFGEYSLALYTFMAKYNRVRTEKFDAWWGVGGTLIDGSVNDLGFTYGLGAELFMAKPISIESNFSQTLINNSSINKFNALLNYHIKRYKLSGGYEHLRIGNQNFSTISLGVSFSF